MLIKDDISSDLYSNNYDVDNVDELQKSQTWKFGDSRLTLRANALPAAVMHINEDEAVRTNESMTATLKGAFTSDDSCKIPTEFDDITLNAEVASIAAVPGSKLPLLPQGTSLSMSQTMRDYGARNTQFATHLNRDTINSYQSQSDYYRLMSRQVYRQTPSKIAATSGTGATVTNGMQRVNKAIRKIDTERWKRP